MDENKEFGMEQDVLQPEEVIPANTAATAAVFSS